MGILFRLLFYILLAASSGAASATSIGDCSRLRDTLQAELLQAWTSEYRPLVCSDNTYRMIQRIRPHLEETVPAQGVYIRKWYPIGQFIEPALARDGQERWSFHMMLVVNGWVVDLDYADFPLVNGWRSYMENMWPVYEGVYIQYKEARDIKNTELGGRFNEYDYPLLKMKDFRQTPPFAADCSQY